MSFLNALAIALLLPLALGLYGGDMLTPRGCWTPLRGIGAWRNAQELRRTVRLVESVRNQPAPRSRT